MWGCPAFFVVGTSTMKVDLKNAFLPLVTEAGAHLVDVEVRSQGKKRLVEVFVDTESGISADELATISRLLGDAIEKGDLVQDAYTLIVSSPGLERPIRHPWQFRRHAGRIARVRWSSQGKEIEHSGEIADVTDEQVLLRDGDGFRAIPHEDIVRAVIEATL
jgi:ribosome maturation factor RimP